MSRVAAIRIEPFQREMAPEASRMLAQAFMANPLHVAAFGASQLRKNEAFFRTGLTVMKGPKFVAIDGLRIVGLIHWVDSGHCQFSALEKLRMVPSMLQGLGIGSAMKVGAWLSQWTKHDPREPHVHLGPIGVAPNAQGQHVGHRLMERYCEELNRAGRAGYLETDRPQNVNFYRRFGFETVAEIRLLGVSNYLMWRN